MKSIDDTVKFVNEVVTWGMTNGVINLDLGTFLFNPNPDSTGVEIERAISCRLRMDESCARQIRDNLDNILRQLEAARAGMSNGAVPQLDTKPPEAGVKAN